MPLETFSARMMLYRIVIRDCHRFALDVTEADLLWVSLQSPGDGQGEVNSSLRGGEPRSSEGKARGGMRCLLAVSADAGHLHPVRRSGLGGRFTRMAEQACGPKSSMPNWVVQLATSACNLG